MDTHNDLKLRKKKVEEMAGALHLWTGTSGEKIGGVMGAFADDRYDGSRAFARHLIAKQCSNEGQETASTLQKTGDVLEAIGVGTLQFIGAVFKGMGEAALWSFALFG